MKSLNTIFSAILLFIIMMACTSQPGSLLPQSSGSFGEIILTMDSAKWRGALGEEIRETFMSSVEGLPRDEPLFSLKYVNPLKLNSLLKSARNMIFVTSFESNSQQSLALKNYFTSGSVSEILKDSTRFIHINDNDFAKGQKVMYLFGKNDQQLINNIKANRERLRDFFNQRVAERMKAGLYAAKELTGINNHLLEKFKFMIRIPFGYEIADDEDNFIWLRNMGSTFDKDLFVTFKPYVSEKQISPDSIIAWRNITAAKYLFEDPEKPETFMVTEKLVPPIADTVNFNNHYSIRLRGLWKTNNLSMGGPFVSYTFVDEDLNRLYYIEGFLYSPGKPQREYMRELDIILSTFRTATELRKTD